VSSFLVIVPSNEEKGIVKKERSQCNPYAPPYVYPPIQDKPKYGENKY
jgi:hypothetical protein